MTDVRRIEQIQGPPGPAWQAHPPTQTLAADDQILLAGTRSQNIASASAIVLESTPTIELGEDGQELSICNVGDETITFQDRNTLPSSALWLADSVQVLDPGEVLNLRWIDALEGGIWKQTTPIA